jgi:hypothetical protein
MNIKLTEKDIELIKLADEAIRKPVEDWEKQRTILLQVINRLSVKIELEEEKCMSCLTK